MFSQRLAIFRPFSFNKSFSVSKSLVLVVLIFFIFLAFLSGILNSSKSNFMYSLQNKWTTTSLQPSGTDISPTNISHIVFAISSSNKLWPRRRNYVEAWWRPNSTRGYIFFDKLPQNPWPNSPIFKVSEDTTKFQVFSSHANPPVIRIVRAILEAYRAEDEPRNVRWYVIGDDDTIFFVENLVSLLKRYDHTKYFYIGGISECRKSNDDFSFHMAYGGAGFALSRPLASALVTHLDYCIEKYKLLAVSDIILQSCIADIGVSLTPHKEFHQIDLVGDISGYLSSAQSPLVTLHHLDSALPIFPSMSRYESVKHLMKAGNSSHQSRLLQQTICYDKHRNWTYSISWGYSVYIFEQIYPRSVLRKPLETFRPWNPRSRPPHYMFNTRKLELDGPCKDPHVFFFESQNVTAGGHLVTSYTKSRPYRRRLPSCSTNSADHVSKIQISSTLASHEMDTGAQCCDLLNTHHRNITTAKLRTCMEGEIVA
ncbi:hypothetical protein ACET3Z_025685 [Daucus carota]